MKKSLSILVHCITRINDHHAVIHTVFEEANRVLTPGVSAEFHDRAGNTIEGRVIEMETDLPGIVIDTSVPQNPIVEKVKRRVR
jgi:hypothetical protein